MIKNLRSLTLERGRAVFRTSEFHLVVKEKVPHLAKQIARPHVSHLIVPCQHLLEDRCAEFYAPSSSYSAMSMSVIRAFRMKLG